jgi:hypothetical protein
MGWTCVEDGRLILQSKSFVPNQEEKEIGEAEHSWGGACYVGAEIGELMCSQNKWQKLIQEVIYIYYSCQWVGAEQYRFL